MARAALTAAILTTMATPATAHPTMKHYVDDHTHDVLLPSLLPNLESQIELELAAEAREEWREIDRRYDARQRRLEREREARATESDSNTVLYSSAIDWQAISMCESSGDWSANTGNSFYGGLQILLSTWNEYGGQEFASYPHLASVEAQIAVAERILDGQGIGAWPTCGVNA